MAGSRASFLFPSALLALAALSPASTVVVAGALESGDRPVAARQIKLNSSQVPPRYPTTWRLCRATVIPVWHVKGNDSAASRQTLLWHAANIVVTFRATDPDSLCGG